MLSLLKQKLLYLGGGGATATNPGTSRVLAPRSSVSVCLAGSGVVCVAASSSEHCCACSVAMDFASGRGLV